MYWALETNDLSEMPDANRSLPIELLNKRSGVVVTFAKKVLLSSLLLLRVCLQRNWTIRMYKNK